MSNKALSRIRSIRTKQLIDQYKSSDYLTKQNNMQRYKAKSRLNRSYSLKTRVVKFCVITTSITVLGCFNWVNEIKKIQIDTSNSVYAVEPSNAVLEGVVTPSEPSSNSAMLYTNATPSASLSERQQILMYIVEKFGDRSHQAIAMLAKCENGSLNPKATNHNRNGTVDRGVFQINSIHGGDEMYDWKTNIDKAYEIYHAHGDTFYAWTCGNVANDRTYVDAMKGR